MKLFSYKVVVNVRGTEREETVVAPSPDAAASAMKFGFVLAGQNGHVVKTSHEGEIFEHRTV